MKGLKIRKIIKIRTWVTFMDSETFISQSNKLVKMQTQFKAKIYNKLHPQLYKEISEDLKKPVFWNDSNRTKISLMKILKLLKKPIKISSKPT